MKERKYMKSFYEYSKDPKKPLAYIAALFLLGSPFLAILTWFGAFLMFVVGVLAGLALVYEGNEQKGHDDDAKSVD